jgi:hypothetical protein
MEFEDGRSLGELLREPGGRLAPDEVRRVAEGLLLGLAAVHAQGFLHRDIKPSNIIIRRDGVPILIDFGAARQAMGSRTRTLTSVLTPQYAPIEQYTVDGKQGPWSDIYSAAAVLHHAVVGAPPPEAASRVGKDPYRPLVESQAGGAFDPAFLAAIDAALAFAPEQRPQSVAEWSRLFGLALPRAHDAPTQRMDAPPAVTNGGMRLSGVNRERPEPAARRRVVPWLALVLVLLIGGAAWRYQAALRDLVSPPPRGEAALPANPMSPAPTPLPPPSAVPAPSPPAVTPAQQALEAPAQKAGADARAIYERAREARAAARAMAGETHIATTRAEQLGLEGAERVTGDDGSTYVGQLVDGKREGLGVLTFKDGDRQAGEWKDNVLNGKGIEQLSDQRYEGQWRNGLPAGLGVRDKPGVERAEGNFTAGRLEGLGVRRVLTEPTLSQTGEFKADQLDGLGVETLANGERYEGQFRAGKRHGFGQLTRPDERARATRWEDGKLVESTP